jgi:CRISPR-associated protein Csb2
VGHNLLLAVRLHGDGQGSTRYHGVWQGVPEWPPAPGRVFQALVAGGARGSTLPEELVLALEWLECLPPPIIATPRARYGQRVSVFVPNNDADALADPRDVSAIRTQKVVHPILLESDAPILYAWSLPTEPTQARAIVNAAEDIYQLGRGVDMAWVVGELVDDEALESRLREHGGTVHRAEGTPGGKTLACPVPGSLASLVRRHQAIKLLVDGAGRSAKLLFTNAPKPHFLSVTYECTQHRVVYELREREDVTRTWPWPLNRVVSLVQALRDGAVGRLREGLSDEHTSIEQMLIGRKADGSNPSPIEYRARIVPLPSIGHEHVDHAVRRILLEVPSGAPLPVADIEWAFSGLEVSNPDTGVVGPFVLMRAEMDAMARRYIGPSRHWRSVTAVALPEGAKRRRIDPARQRQESKNAIERIGEEDQAAVAVQVALRHTGIRATVVTVRVQREPFEAKGARVEAFADGTRFAKERLWHVDFELDRPIEGPLVIGDGRFLGLGVMAPVAEPWSKSPKNNDTSTDRQSLILIPPRNRSGIIGLAVGAGAKDEPVELAVALRRAVMARVQMEIGRAPLGRFFSGHETLGAASHPDQAGHLAFQWDAGRRRLLVIAPHWLDRREPTRDERRAIEILNRALEDFGELRAGSAGRFAVRRHTIDVEDPLLVATRSWLSVSPYTVTRHRKHSSATEVLVEDAIIECNRRGLPTPKVTVLDARGVPGRGLEGHIRLDFIVALAGPILLGRTRHLGGGLFAPAPGDGS